MKQSVYHTLLLLLGLTAVIQFSGCKSEGCTDPAAANYDPDAKQDDGTCTYVSGTFNLKVAYTFGGTPLVRNQTYTDPHGNTIFFDGFKLFLSHITLLDGTGGETELSEVALVDLTDAASQTITGNFPAQHIAGIRFGIGLDSALNHSDPITFSSDHPMSSASGMYWSWATQYIFAKLDAEVDTTAGQTGTNLLSLVYHTGRDTLYREKTIMGWDLNLMNGSTTHATLTLDLQNVLNGPTDTIQYWLPGQNITHSEDLQLDLARRVTDNYVTAFY